MADQPTDAELARIQEAGRVLAPFLTVWAATHLLAARYQAHPLEAMSQEQRTQMADDSIRDALRLLKTI